MRPIKFRAWDERSKTMFEIDTLGLTEKGAGPGIGTCSWVSVPFQPQIKVMQFTGLHDKNGKEIYEGDVLLEDDRPVIYTIGWNEDIPRFEYRTKYNKNQHSWSLTCDDVLHMEVIGNIYENPELLKETT